MGDLREPSLLLAAVRVLCRAIWNVPGSSDTYTSVNELSRGPVTINPAEAWNRSPAVVVSWRSHEWEMGRIIVIAPDHHAPVAVKS